MILGRKYELWTENTMNKWQFKKKIQIDQIYDFDVNFQEPKSKDIKINSTVFPMPQFLKLSDQK